MNIFNSFSKTFFISAFLYCAAIHNCFAQEEESTSILLEQVAERNSSASDEEQDLSELTAIYTELLRRPIDLNSASAEELRATGLFNEVLIANIMNHKERFGKLLTISELQVIEGFDENFIRSIIPYITVGRGIDEPNASFSRMVHEGRHQLILRSQLVPEKRKGFDPETTSSHYLGDPLSLYVRYKFAFMRKLSWGITAEKDAGEQFFKGAQSQGFDFYSFHFCIRDVGIFKTIVAGDYQLEYGQGLTLSTGLSGGKATDPAQTRRNARGIYPYTSSNEAFYKRGAVVSLRMKKIVTDLFISHRRMDGNFQSGADSLNTIDYVTSFQESGYHRTQSEIDDKNKVTEWMYGGHVSYKSKNIQLGFTGVSTKYDVPLLKNIQPYNQFEFSGSSLTNFGFDYTWLYRNINFFGETSVDPAGTVATVNGILLCIDPRLTTSFVHRFYPRNFHSLYAAGLRESGGNYNESGIYSCMTFKPSRVITINCTYDRFYFPWLRYRTDAPSTGSEFSGIITYTPNRKSEFYVRFRESDKVQNGSEEETIVSYPVPVKQHGVRVHLTTKISPTFTLRTRVEFTNYQKEATNENGFMMFQDVQYHPMGSKLSFNMRYAIFDTDSYDSRLYAYENDVLYGYSIPPYYYKGTRVYFNIRYKIMKGWDCWLRYAATFYSNKNVIGSGLDEIQGSRKSDLKIQVRFEF